MPRGLKRYQQAGELHFITFSCYRRQPLLATPQAKRTFEQTLERVRTLPALSPNHGDKGGASTVKKAQV